jgi:hypothetical protein
MVRRMDESECMSQEGEMSVKSLKKTSHRVNV